MLYRHWWELYGVGGRPSDPGATLQTNILKRAILSSACSFRDQSGRPQTEAIRFSLDASGFSSSNSLVCPLSISTFHFPLSPFSFSIWLISIFFFTLLFKFM